MPAYIDQCFDEFHNQIYIENLPSDVTAQQIRDLFGSFGLINKLYLKRRILKHSPLASPRPYVNVIYERRESVDQVMSARPFFINDCQLFVRRCLPITRRYPYEAQTTTTKILLRIPRDNHHEILPNDSIITEYLKSSAGRILRFERFDDKTVLIEFNDYDPVDVYCLSRPHCINNQLIEIEKCADEQQARRRAQYRQKLRSITLKLSPTSTHMNTSSGNILSPTLTLNTSEQTVQLRLTYDDKTNYLENKHEQLVSSLKTEWEQIAKERIRLQRLTLDYQEDRQRLKEENRQWKKLYSKSSQETSRIQNEGERLLLDANEKYSRAKRYYEQLIQDIHQKTV